MKHIVMKIGLVPAWLLTLTLLLFGNVAQAAVTATVDQNPVVQGQAVTLTLRVEDEDGEPDLTALSRDFRVLSQSTSSQVQFINGSVSRWKDWNIQLLPTKTGKLTIPAIPVGQARSAAIQLTVTKAAAARSKEAWVEFSVTPERVWQGQQLLVDVELYYASSVRSGDLSKPEVSGAILEQIGEDQTEQTVKNGVRYNRLKRRYVVFPEQAGLFEIGGPVFNGQAEAPTAPSRSFGGLFRNTRHVVAAAENVTVNVQPALAGADFWLPAQDVSLIADWKSDGGGKPEFRVGQPVTRVVTLTAYGLLATQLPDLEIEYPGMRAYPEAAEQETRGSAQGVIGIRHYRSALIPQQPGDYVLPELEVKWWDVNRGEWAAAVLPAETITVLPSANAAAPLMVAPEPCEPAAPVLLTPEANELEAEKVCDSAAAPTAPQEPTYWRWVALGFAALWLATLLWLLASKYRHQRRKPVTDARNSEVAQAKRELVKVCGTNNAMIAAKSLANLASVAGLAVSSPAAVAAEIDDVELAAELQALDVACYGGSTNWNGAGLAEKLGQSDWPLPAKGSTANVLPSLYPQ